MNTVTESKREENTLFLPLLLRLELHVPGQAKSVCKQEINNSPSSVDDNQLVMVVVVVTITQI